MPFGSDPLDALVIPDGTRAEERDIVTAGDAVIGGKSTVEFGVRARSVLAGERVRFGGGLEAERDCRLDTWCDVNGNVLVGRDAYLGERVHVAGQLLVNGDLDVGDDASIDEGFEANGFIHIRNPLPLYLFLVIYLTHLLRRGALDDASTFLEAMGVEDDTETEPGIDDPDPLLIPRKSRVSDDRWEVSTPAQIGDGCRLHGNIRATSILVGSDTACYGSLRSEGRVEIGSDTVVHGDITAPEGVVTIVAGAVVKGDVDCDILDLHTDADIEGRIFTSGEVRIRSPLEPDSDRSAVPDADREDADTPASEDDYPPPSTDSERSPEVDSHDPGPADEAGPDPAPTGAINPAPSAEAGSEETAAQNDSPTDPDEWPDIPIIDAEVGTDSSHPPTDESADQASEEPGLGSTATIIADLERESLDETGDRKDADPQPGSGPDDPDIDEDRAD